MISPVPTLSLQWLQRVVSPADKVALHPMHESLTFANFMMPPEAIEGVDTCMLLV